MRAAHTLIPKVDYTAAPATATSSHEEFPLFTGPDV